MSCPLTMSRTIRKAVSSFSVSVMSVNVVLGTVFAALPVFLPVVSAVDPLASCTPPDAALVAYWKFDEANASDLVLDSSASNNGTAAGAGGVNNLPQPVPGTTFDFSNAKAKSFDGTDDYVSVPNDPSLQLSNGTLSTWIKTSGAGSSYRSIFAKGNAYGLFLKDDVLLAYDWGTATDRSTGVNLADGLWHHVAMSFNSGVAGESKIYIDGVLSLTTTMTVADQLVAPEIGRGGTNGGTNQLFSGEIDDIRLYSSALSQTEVQRLSDGKCAIEPFTTSVSIGSDINPSLDGQDVTFTAVVSGGFNVTGTVEFRDNGVAIGTSPLVGGIATLVTSTLTGNGTVHPITSHYNGDDNNATSDSALTLSQTVNTLPTLTVVKNVVNDDGGTLDATTVPLFFDAGALVTSGTSTSASSVISGITPGPHTVSETNTTGYAAAFTDDCATDGTITLNFNENKTCTITNDDIAPKLTVTKVVVTDNGGTQVITDFPLFIDAMSVTSGVQNTTTIGAHVISETTISSQYDSIITGDCDSSGNITLALGDVKSCVITNDDKPAHIHVIKNVTNDNGGTKVVSDFTVNVTGNSASPSSFAGSTGTDVTINVGSYSIVETADSGYEAHYSTDCSGSLLPGDSKTCTITNDDIQPKLTVTKVVINDNGGTKVVEDFPLFVDSSAVISGFENGFDVGTYTVSETGLSTYQGTISGDCALDGTISLALGEVKSCTITNDDIAPTFTIIKKVINDDNGTATSSNFVLKIDGLTVIDGIATSLNVGGYRAKEIEDAAYDGTFSGDCDVSNGYIFLNLAENKTCTITNNDRPRFFPSGNAGGAARIQGNGGHRGNGTDQFAAKATFAFSGVHNTAPGSFGGGPDVPLSKGEIEYICSMQKSIPDDALASFVEWLGGYMAGLMDRDAGMVTSALKDSTFCAPKQAAAPVKKADIIVHQNSKGVVVSTNPVWNSCVSGQGLTLALIRSNTDTYLHRQGTIRKTFAKTCRDYHRGDVSMWDHPDYPGLVIKLDSSGRLAGGLPIGFIAKKDVLEKVASK